MKKNSASCLKLREMRITNCHSITTGLLLSFITTAFVSLGQPAANKKDPRAGLLSVAYFVESANNSVNSLNSLLKKDNYRNKC